MPMSALVAVIFAAATLAVDAKPSAKFASPPSVTVEQNDCTSRDVIDGEKFKFTVLKTKEALNCTKTYEAACKSVKGLTGVAKVGPQTALPTSNWNTAVRTIMKCVPDDTTSLYLKGRRHAKIQFWNNDNYKKSAPEGISLVAPKLQGDSYVNGEVGAVSIWANPENYALCTGWPEQGPSFRCDFGVPGVFIVTKKATNRVDGDANCRQNTKSSTGAGGLLTLTKANRNIINAALKSDKGKLCGHNNYLFTKGWESDVYNFPTGNPRLVYNVNGVQTTEPFDQLGTFANVPATDQYGIELMSICSE